MYKQSSLSSLFFILLLSSQSSAMEYNGSSSPLQQKMGRQTWDELTTFDRWVEKIKTAEETQKSVGTSKYLSHSRIQKVVKENLKGKLPSKNFYQEYLTIAQPHLSSAEREQKMRILSTLYNYKHRDMGI